jgi:hypothetical protein
MLIHPGGISAAAALKKETGIFLSILMMHLSGIWKENLFSLHFYFKK